MVYFPHVTHTHTHHHTPSPYQGIHGQFIFIVESVENASLPVPFRVDHVEGEGELVVDGELDYETVTSYNLRVSST